MNLNDFCKIFISSKLDLSSDVINYDDLAEKLLFEIAKIFENNTDISLDEESEGYNLIIACLKLKKIPTLPLKVISSVSDKLRKDKEYEIAAFLLKDFYLKNPNHLNMAFKYATSLHDLRMYDDANSIFKFYVEEKLEKIKNWQMFLALRTLILTNSKEYISSLFSNYSKIVDHRSAIIIFSKAFIDLSKYEEGYEFWTTNLTISRDYFGIEESLIEFELLRLKGDVKLASDFLKYSLEKHNNAFELRRQIVVMNRTNSFYEAISRLEVQNYKPELSKIIYNTIKYDVFSGSELVCPWGVSNNAWHEISKIVSSFDSDKIIPCVNTVSSITKPVNKIFVAGMDWSGSGAVQHYLLEYKKIMQVPGGELQFLAGVGGLKSILDSSGSRAKVKNAIIDFLGYHVLLSNSPSGNQESKALMTSSLLLTKLNIDKFLQVLIRMVYRLRLNWDSSDGIRYALQEYVNGVLLSLVNYSDDIVYLIDNAVGLFKCEAMQIVDNFYYFAVVRDPRSNFVTRVRQDTSYKRDVDKYIDVYRSRRESFEKGRLNIVGRTDGTIELVQFENFVCDENFREQLAIKCGLDPLDSIKYSKFKPWESMKNVTIYYDYKNREELIKLECELNDYCWIEKDKELIV